MSLFFLIAALGYVFLAIVAILDKFILTKELRPASFAFFTTIFFFGSFLLLPFSDNISFSGLLVALVSAFGFGFGTLAMFLALRHGEATHVVPFIGAVTAVFAYGFSSLFLGEALGIHQTVGVTFLILATLLFSYEKTTQKKAVGLHKSFGWALLSGILYAASHVAAKYFYGEYSFITGLAWTKGLVGIVALSLLLSPSVRRDIFHRKSPKNTFWIVGSNMTLGIIGTVAIQYAISIGSVAVVSGLVGLQYALIMVFAALSTFFVPRFFKEYFTRKEVFLEIAAILLVAAGVFLLV